MMKTLSPVVSPILMVFLALGATPVAAASAGSPLVSTQEALEAADHDADRERIMETLNREDVREALAAQGVDLEKAEARVAALSDEEARQMAEQLDELPAGADVGTVVGVLFVIFVILLVTDLLGLTNFYPFTR